MAKRFTDTQKNKALNDLSVLGFKKTAKLHKVSISTLTLWKNQTKQREHMAEPVPASAKTFRTEVILTQDVVFQAAVKWFAQQGITIVKF